MTKHPEDTLNNLRNVNVLVGEDDVIFMLLTSKMLERKNANVLKAFNGIEVLKLLDDGTNTHIILLDLEMPEMDGYTTVKKIREKFSNIPVLALTSHVIDRQTESKLLKQGFTDTISKPFRPELLYSKILKALGKN